MTPFEYVSVLLSIVISIALARMLTGIARMIGSGVVRFSIPLALYSMVLRELSRRTDPYLRLPRKH